VLARVHHFLRRSETCGRDTPNTTSRHPQTAQPRSHTSLQRRAGSPSAQGPSSEPIVCTRTIWRTKAEYWTLLLHISIKSSQLEGRIFYLYVATYRLQYALCRFLEVTYIGVYYLCPKRLRYQLSQPLPDLTTAHILISYADNSILDGYFPMPILFASSRG